MPLRRTAIFKLLLFSSCGPSLRFRRAQSGTRPTNARIHAIGSTRAPQVVQLDHQRGKGAVRTSHFGHRHPAPAQTPLPRQLRGRSLTWLTLRTSCRGRMNRRAAHCAGACQCMSNRPRTKEGATRGTHDLQSTAKTEAGFRQARSRRQVITCKRTAQINRAPIQSVVDLCLLDPLSRRRSPSRISNPRML